MSEVFGWLATVATIAAAVVGIFLRRARHPPAMVVRMRPHVVLGYVALASALAHVAVMAGKLHMRDFLDLKAASLALAALGAQTAIGFALSQKIRSRKFVRAWHVCVAVVISLTVLVHVMAGGAL